MSIKRYEVNGSSSVFEDESGSLVDYQDYSALEAKCAALAAENAELKSNLMFWDAEDPEAPYDSPEEIAESCSLNYNEEFIVQVANRLPNRTYRVCESWEHECKIELVEGGEVKTPATDAFLAEVRAYDLNALISHYSAELDAHISNGGNEFDDKSTRLRHALVGARMFREELRKGASA